MIDRKEFELLFRAKLQGSDLKSIAKSIEEIEKAIESQAAAAKRGENSIDELKASLEALNRIQKQLVGQADLVGRFQQAGEKAKTAAEKVKLASEAYAAYSKTLEGVTERTESQEKKLDRLTKARDRSEATLKRQLDLQAQYRQQLEESGVAIDEIANTEVRLRDTAASLALVLQRGNQEIDSYATNVRKARDEIKAKAAADAEGVRNATLFEQAERRAAEAVAARARAAREAQESRSNRNAEVAANSRADDEERAARRRQQELAALRADIIARSEQSAKDSGLRKTADDAEAAAQKYQTLARASNDLRPKIVSLRDAIDAISDPAAAASKGFDAIERKVSDLSSTIEKIKGPVRDYQERLRELGSASKQLSSQAGALDGYRQQLASLQAIRAKFVEARAEVTRYAAAVREGGESGAASVRALGEAQSKLSAASAALARQIVATRSARDALRAAGVDTSNLSQAQARMTDTAKKAASATEQLRAAVDRYGEAQERASKKGGWFSSTGERTTLSFMQRLRGEFLSMTTAAVGLYTAVNAIKGSLDVMSSREGARNQLALSVGNDKKAIDEEYNYVKAQSERIGLVFDDALKNYAKLSASARMAGRDQKQVRYLWESFQEVGRVANLSADEMSGVTRALDQVISKGKIQAEELRGQLGERLFGVFQVAAQALKDQFPDLDKALQNGQVDASQLLAIAQKYREIVADQLPAATNSLAANQARLTNAVADFKEQIAQAGFGASYSELIKRLADFLKGEDAQKLAKFIGSALASITDLFTLAIEHGEELRAIFVAIAAAMTIKVVQDYATSMMRVVTELGNVEKAGKGAGVALTGIQKAFLLLQSFIIGWEIGSYLREKFQIVRVLAINAVANFDEAWTRIKYGAQIAWEEIPRYVENAFKAIVNTVTSQFRLILTGWQKVAIALGRTEVASNIGAAIDALTLKYSEQGKKVTDLRRQMESDIKRIRQTAKEMMADEYSAGGVKLASGATSAGAPTAFPGTGGNSGKGGLDDKAIAKRAKEIESINDALDAIENRLDRAKSNTLAQQLEAVDRQYEDLKERIMKLGGSDAKSLLGRLNGLRDELIAKVRKDFNEALLKDQQGIQNKLNAIASEAGKKEVADLDARLKAIRLKYEDNYKEIADFRQKLVENKLPTDQADQAKENLDALVKQLGVLEEIKFNKERQAVLDRALNDQIALRQQLIQTVKDQQDAGLISEEQAVKNITQINAAAVPSIIAAANASRDWAAANAAIFDSPEQQQAFIARMDAIVASTSATAGAFTKLEQTSVEVFSGAAGTALNSLSEALGGLVAGTMSWKDALDAARMAALNMFAEVLRGIAQAIIKQQMLNAVLAISKAFGWGGMANAATAAGAQASVNHSGGIIGGTANRTRVVPSAWFDNAPRYHTGGIAGSLAPNEIPAILQRGEEVLSKDSPRNILNGGAAAGGQSPVAASPSIKIVNAIDSGSVISEGLSSSEGQKAIINFFRANRTGLKTILGS